MLNKIIKSIRYPKKAWRFFCFMLRYTFRKRKGTLIIIGMEPGGTFSLMHRGFEKCYGFEAHPERFQKLEKKYKNNRKIELYNVAVAREDGEVSFNISNNNNGASSSIGNFDEKWNKEHRSQKVKMVKTITVPCINLYNFCKKKNINVIDEYVSDIQGMDLEVLKTLEPMIKEKRIYAITCEVTKDERKNIYVNLPDNSESGFHKLLSENYELIARGWGVLKDGKIEKIRDDAWEMDCKWKVKK